jgi:PAS domain-containing protein
MSDQEKTKEQLIRELADARRRLEVAETERQRWQEEFEQEMRDHRRVEETLQEGEEQYHQIFNAIADSLFVGDLEGRIVAANPAACEAHGYTQEEIIGLPVLGLIPPDDHPWFDEFLKVVETGGTYRAESVELR